MKIYDISQELFGCCVFPGDPAPEKERVLSIADGDACNLTKLSMCAHNGTHLDAPFHFYKDGKTGKAVVTLKAAKAMNRHGICLVGVESQTVGPEDSPREVHLELLEKEVVLLEGLRLANVPDGTYLLNAAPMNLGGCDGAPCRAVLLEQ